MWVCGYLNCSQIPISRFLPSHLPNFSPSFFSTIPNPKSKDLLIPQPRFFPTFSSSDLPNFRSFFIFSHSKFDVGRSMFIFSVPSIPPSHLPTLFFSTFPPSFFPPSAFPIPPSIPPYLPALASELQVVLNAVIIRQSSNT